MNKYKISTGWLDQAQQFCSPHSSPRTVDDGVISLLVIHNISLPPGQFGQPYIADLFMGNLDASAHPYFKEIAQLRVSAHCLIQRSGHIIQFVNFNRKAWHAGVSAFENRDKCNDYSIGIELEGTDTTPYTNEQYDQLAKITLCLQKEYPDITDDRIVGHCDIAPGRKTDPGDAFDWHYFKNCLQKLRQNPL